MQKVLAKYEVAVYECTGQYPRLFHVETPLMDDDTKVSQFRRPASDEDFVECPSCLHTMSVSEVTGNTHKAGTPRKIQTILPMVKPNKDNKDPLGFNDDAGKTGDTKDDERDNWWSGMLTPNIARRMACSARGESHHQYTQEEEALLSKIMLTFDFDNNADDSWYQAWSDTWSDARLPLEASTTMHPTTSGSTSRAMKHMHGMSETKSQATTTKDDHDLWNPNKRGAPKGQIGVGGFLGPCSAMLLMSLLYSARAARFDLFKPINYLAKMITRWDSLNDQRLHRLMCYIYSSADHVLSNWIGDDPKI